MHILLLGFLSLLNTQRSQADGWMSLRLVLFSSDGHLESGLRCDSDDVFCDIAIDVCIKTHIDEKTCDAHENHQVSNNSNSVDFRILPTHPFEDVRFHFKGAFKPPIIVVEVHDVDLNRYTKADRIDSFLIQPKPIKPDAVKMIFTKGLRDHVPTSLKIQYSMHCAENFYGDRCELSCGTQKLFYSCPGIKCTHVKKRGCKAVCLDFCSLPTTTTVTLPSSTTTIVTTTTTILTTTITTTNPTTTSTTTVTTTTTTTVPTTTTTTVHTTITTTVPTTTTTTVPTTTTTTITTTVSTTVTTTATTTTTITSIPTTTSLITTTTTRLPTTTVTTTAPPVTLDQSETPKTAFNNTTKEDSLVSKATFKSLDNTTTELYGNGTGPVNWAEESFFMDFWYIWLGLLVLFILIVLILILRWFRRRKHRTGLLHIQGRSPSNVPYVMDDEDEL